MSSQVLFKILNIEFLFEYWQGVQSRFQIFFENFEYNQNFES
jgi:hypothetical protein